MKSLLLEAILGYANRGWRVFPLTHGQKTPALDRWPDVATIEIEKIREWWTGRFQRCGVGIATGRGSGIFVVDVDSEKSGEESLIQLIEQYGRLPPTVECITGNGRHLYYQYPEACEIRNTTRLAGLAGLDVRGEGGYVVAPPSVHPNGSTYRWNELRDPGLFAVAPAPPWLLEIVVRQGRNGKSSDPGHPLLIPVSIPIGCRNSTLTSLAGGLRREGYEPEEIEPLLLEVRRRRCEGIEDSSTSFPEEETRAIARSVGRYERVKEILPVNEQGWLAEASARSLGEIMAGERPARQPSILGEGLLPERSLACLFGSASVGKTQLAIALALAVAAGRDFYGWNVSACNVLYLCPEIDLSEFWDRVEAIERAECETRAWNPQAPAVRTSLGEARRRVFPVTGDMLPQLPDLTQEKDRQAIVAAAKARGAKLLLLDPFALLHTAEESSNDDMLKVMRGLHEIKNEADTTPLVIHHPRKGKPGQTDPGHDAMRGAGAIGAHARVILRLDEKRGKVCLSCVKATHTRIPEPIWFARLSSGPLVRTTPAADPSLERDQRLEAVVAYVQSRGGLDVTLDEIKREVSEVSELRDRTIRSYLQLEADSDDARIDALGATKDRRWRARG